MHIPFLPPAARVGIGMLSARLWDFILLAFFFDGSRYLLFKSSQELYLEDGLIITINKLLDIFGLLLVARLFQYYRARSITYYFKISAECSSLNLSVHLFDTLTSIVLSSFLFCFLCHSYILLCYLQ